MRFFVIGDKETVVGFSLIGIEGLEVNSKTEAINALKKVLSRKDIGIILITEKTAKRIQSTIDELLCQKRCILVLQIPDFTGVLQNQSSVEELVLSALGVRI